MKDQIRIYKGGGALRMCSEAMHQFLSASFARANGGTYDVSFIDEHELRSQTALWQDRAALIVFSGGGVTAFKHALGETGLSAIKGYVSNGGHYLGTCAGGYFGAAQIEFTGYDLAKRTTYQKQSPGLGFFNGVARGSISTLAPLYDGTSATCAATNVWCYKNDTGNIIEASGHVFYGGGPEFIPSPQSQHRELSHYLRNVFFDDAQDPHKNAPLMYLSGVQTSVGHHGGGATLLSWHPELTPGFIRDWAYQGHTDEGKKRIELADKMDQLNQGGATNKTPQNWVINHLRTSIK
jgi:glutamine amidotransferase-like uncharacterized protein